MRQFVRREKESLIINRNIQVTIMEVNHDSVRISISSPGNYQEHVVRIEDPQMLTEMIESSSRITAK